MKYNKLGNTDIDVSLICLGTMTYGEQNTEQEGHDQMDLALDHGVNFFDTAELYAVPTRPETQGKTEEIIGTWFNKSGKRSDVVLATKIAGPSKFTQHIRTDKDFTAANIKSAIDGSLKRLQTDYIDLYQLHWPARRTNYFGTRDYKHDNQWEDNLASVVRALDAEIKSGRIRHFGLSNETPWGLSKFIAIADSHGLPRPVSVQNPYSLVNRLYEIGMAEISIREQVGLLAYSPSAFGLLTGKFFDGSNQSEARFIKYQNRLPRYSGKATMDVAKKYTDLAKAHDLLPIHLALAFLNQQEFLTSTIIGATNLNQLKENISSADIELSGELIKEINKIHATQPNPAP